jgi:hypothetical protein
VISALEGDGWLAPCPGRFTPGKDLAPIVQRAGWDQRPVWTCAKNLTPTGIHAPDRPARSQSLYRLSYLGPYIYVYLFIFNCNYVDTRWQQYSTHLHTNSTQNTENGKYIKIKNIGNWAPLPVFASYTLEFLLQLRKSHGKTSVMVVEKCPDIPVAVVFRSETNRRQTPGYIHTYVHLSSHSFNSPL